MQASSTVTPSTDGISAVASTCAPGFTSTETRAWFGLLHSSAQLTRELDGDLVATHGLPLNAFEVLMRLSLADSGQVRMSELARQVVLSLSGLSRLVDRLERDGLLERRTCPSDARGFFATITPAGRERLAEAQSDYLANVRARFLERFSPEELELLAGFWDRVAPGGCRPAPTT
ncbi:MAG: Transcriptional regulator, MarR family [uncultured Thermoleophilia bacterium]|uniref:Transcriptional regulator, MarR family n=1 Tax=uncultured Thermoleophilia bacterium TaxID=1497501 RepID=A0A6J4TVJ4_9ACTN|nr:MAG: Transcriptional regulator, MarR family [uncultured Thermoleophilia bacterium]